MRLVPPKLNSGNTQPPQPNISSTPRVSRAACCVFHHHWWQWSYCCLCACRGRRGPAVQWCAATNAHRERHRDKEGQASRICTVSCFLQHRAVQRAQLKIRKKNIRRGKSTMCACTTFCVLHSRSCCLWLCSHDWVLFTEFAFCLFVCYFRSGKKKHVFRNCCVVTIRVWATTRTRRARLECFVAFSRNLFLTYIRTAREPPSLPIGVL